MKNIICKKCVMDTTDTNILFDENGVCIYCLNFEKKIKPYWDNLRNSHKLKKIINEIKLSKSNKLYNSIIGVSGGVDSSYLLHYAVKEMGLKPLVYHVDAGWNSKLAVENIEKIIDKLNLELNTDVIYWPEIRDLQLSFFKAGVPHLDTPQDHAFFASMYNYAFKNNIKYILNGGNFSTECIREPLLWHYHASDTRHLREIHRIFGSRKLEKFPIADIFKYKILFKYIYGIKVIQPLNYINFNKQNAKEILKKEYDWVEYSHKHYESRFTKFYEGYWLLKKFGFDKRKAHFSSLILTDQMKREEALNQLKSYPVSEEDFHKDIRFVADKLEISTDQLNHYLNSKNYDYRNYKSNFLLINFFTKLANIIGLEKRIIH